MPKEIAPSDNNSGVLITPAATRSWVSLPVEVVGHILQYLSEVTIFQLETVSKTTQSHVIYVVKLGISRELKLFISALSEVDANNTSQIKKLKEIQCGIPQSSLTTHPETVKKDIIIILRTLNQETLNALLQSNPSVFLKNLLAPSALHDISKDLAEAGNFHLAIRVANSISDLAQRSTALKNVSLFLARAGNIDFSIQIANSIPYPKERSDALLDVSLLLIHNRNIDLAIQILELATQAANSTHDTTLQTRALNQISMTLAHAGYPALATQVANYIPDLEERSNTLKNVFSILAQAGKLDFAIQVINLAIQVANSIPRIRLRGVPLKEISYTMALNGNFDLAIEVANSIPFPKMRSDALSSISVLEKEYNRRVPRTPAKS